MNQGTIAQMKLFWSICIMQCLLVLVLFFGDIGFDKPGKFGLAFDHLLILLILFFSLFIAAVFTVFRARQWKFLSAQLVLLALAAAGIVTN